MIWITKQHYGDCGWLENFMAKSLAMSNLLREEKNIEGNFQLRKKNLTTSARAIVIVCDDNDFRLQKPEERENRC